MKIRDRLTGYVGHKVLAQRNTQTQTAAVKDVQGILSAPDEGQDKVKR